MLTVNLKGDHMAMDRCELAPTVEGSSVVFRSWSPLGLDFLIYKIKALNKWIWKVTEILMVSVSEQQSVGEQF